MSDSGPPPSQPIPPEYQTPIRTEINSLRETISELRAEASQVDALRTEVEWLRQKVSELESSQPTQQVLGVAATALADLDADMLL